jgi:DNA-binding response OmpR family regulator
LLIKQTLEDLEERGIEIITAENGKEAYEMICAEKPNLVFLDIMMPIMNGYEVCGKVKAEFKEDIFVVLLTAKGQEVDRRQGEQAGANRYITKPFDPDELLDLAEKMLGR